MKTQSKDEDKETIMGKMILSIDDSSTTRKMMKKPVEAIGYELLEATDGQNGLDVLANNMNDVALILLDWNMPGMNGIDFLEHVHSKVQYKSIPIIMVTTEAEKANVVKALKFGIKNYILKPFTSDELILKMNQCLGRG